MCCLCALVLTHVECVMIQLETERSMSASDTSRDTSLDMHFVSQRERELSQALDIALNELENRSIA